jgi:hypothetical protein
MHAWNAAGAQIRFEAASGRAEADVVVQYGALRQQGRANVGYEPDGTTVWLVRGLKRRVATTIVAHELGHVLGLGHESHGCALMAPVVNVGAASRCGLAACRVLWSCLVQPDDAKGLRLLYGRRPPS